MQVRSISIGSIGTIWYTIWYQSQLISKPGDNLRLEYMTPTIDEIQFLTY